jgi:L-amino acid N-acyltransferase YncA
MLVANLASAKNPVRRLAGPLYGHVRNNSELEKYVPLGTFSCGNSAIEQSASEVNTTAERLYAGEAVPQKVVMLEEEYGLVGICSVCVYGRMGVTTGPYINALGRDSQYRGCLLGDNVSYVGDALLYAGLELISRLAAPHPMPEVRALVLPDNEPSLKIFRRYGFERHGEWGGQVVQARPAGRPIDPVLSRDAYLPPRRV